ncbi:MAG: type II toxin-antitoxin system HicB family antitoxin [Calditrichaceae bacterium]|jgi:predicted RNase H-like HicB family nuclease
MKISVEKEFDGVHYVACCTNVPGCYLQSDNPEELNNDLEYGLEVYLENCLKRNQPFPNETDKPVLDVRIRFETISAEQIIKIFKRYHYYVDHQDNQVVLFLNSEFPFNRVLISNRESISPLIISRIFGKANTIFVSKESLRLNSSAS